MFVVQRQVTVGLNVSQISLADFMSTLTGAGSEPPLRRVLPGTTKSIYDSLGGCL